jgi:DNA adenine methylase
MYPTVRGGILSKPKAISIRSYQPFRYPGGKTRLARNPVFRSLLDPMLEGADTFYEGFLGSAAVTLDVAIRYPNMKFVATDYDSTIAGFWELIGEGTEDQVQELLTLIAQPPTVELFRALRERGKHCDLTLVERAYHAIFFNRTTFSGIAMAQPIGGYGQKSKWTIDCRYNAPLLQKKVQNLRKLLAGRLTVTCEDAILWLQRIPAGVPLYLDPPYFVKGDVLYPVKMDEMQHGKLADQLATRTNWVMSYDICEEIREKYNFAKLIEIGFRYSINGKKSNWKNTNEFLITSSSPS